MSAGKRRKLLYDIDLVAETRQEALRDGIGYYHGLSCEKCGGDVRVISTSACLNCRRSKRDRSLNEKHLNRDRNLQRDYGITSADYHAMLLHQGGRCAICRRLPTGNKVLNVDHDHATGMVRRLLCTSCNVALGHLSDDPSIVLAVFYYLLAHGKPDPRCHMKPIDHHREQHAETERRQDPGCQAQAS